MSILVLGDQLTRRHGPVAHRPDERILLIESRDFARRLPYHPHKLTLVFGAMRAYREALRDTGREVVYITAPTFREGLSQYFERYPGDELVMMRPISAGANSKFQQLIEEMGGSLTSVENELFLCSREQFSTWVDGRSQPYRHEQFYRFMRRETGYLMDGEKPVGGQWNYDDRNREVPEKGYEPPDPPQYEPDEQLMDLFEWVTEEFAGGYEDESYGGDWADPGPFHWPVTREQALDALADFVEKKLPQFGPYQDAMVEDEWAMHHSLLSATLNLGLLHPSEVVESVIDAYQSDPDVPIESAEGFVRQVIGWREFLRGVYTETMPELGRANQLNATADLPHWYWTGDTRMACLSGVIDGVRERGYSHHIERLMVLSNFALIYGVEPEQLNRWFHAAYVDAFHWVTTPNVMEMGLYAAGAFATKPYASSANYIDKMSDYCSDCPYDKDKTIGSDACPFNALYWGFLARNEETLRSNHRMGLMYSHVDNKELGAIEQRVAAIREQSNAGTL